jgi:hypothetical protein
LWGLLGIFIVFIATTFVGRPLYLFINLRSETASAIARYERFHTLFAPLEEQWPADRRSTYEVLGSRLVAFASANVLLTKILDECGFDLQSAGDDLLILSQTIHGQPDSSDVQTRIVSVLKLKLYPL